MHGSKLLKTLSILSLFAVVALAIPSLSRAEAHGNVNFFLGLKNLSESDWEPVENQREFGAEVDFGDKDWPIHIATDIFLSKDDEGQSGFDVDGKTMELGVGVRKVWYQHETFRPYFGGGLALIMGEAEIENGGSIDDDDQGIGGWVGGGIVWRIGSTFQLGAALRYSQAEIELFGEDIKAGGVHYGLLLGFGWPGNQ